MRTMLATYGVDVSSQIGPPLEPFLARIVGANVRLVLWLTMLPLFVPAVDNEVRLRT